jgi:catechol 2,3-dioxygenase-like lactoylglutathione lyase family enzyme
MASPKVMGSSLAVLVVKDLARSQSYYRDVLGFNVTDWWVERDGLSGLAFKLLQAKTPEDVRPNAAAEGQTIGVDIYVYVDNWTHLESLLKEFQEKGAYVAQEIVTHPDGGPWKEFIISDPDGYSFAFGGVDGRPGGRRSPLIPHIGSVVLFVRNLEKAVDRYARLLDLNVNESDRYFGHMHSFKLENGTDISLDSNGVENVPILERGPVLFGVHTDDIDAAETHAISLGFEVVYGIMRYPGM